jgi:hypothetical protein
MDGNCLEMYVHGKGKLLIFLNTGENGNENGKEIEVF